MAEAATIAAPGSARRTRQGSVSESDGRDGNPADDPGSPARSGRFAGAADAFVQGYTASIATDVLLFRHDIAGSRAHARMLAAQRIIPAADAAAILRGLDQV